MIYPIAVEIGDAETAYGIVVPDSSLIGCEGNNKWRKPVWLHCPSRAGSGMID
jgi:hypothetical protein